MRALFLPCLLVCWLWPRVASSQSVDVAGAPPAPAEATGAYDAALSEALAAHARGDYVQARASMERAHQIEPSARTLRGLGIVAFAQERHLEAIRYLQGALASQEKALSSELRAGVEELLGHAFGQVGRYELLLTPEDGTFLVDGKEPDLYAPRTIVLTPANHTLTALGPGRAPYTWTVNVKPGEQRTLHVVLASPAAAERAELALPAGRRGPQTSTPVPAPAFWTPKVRWITVGTSAALVASGAALWGLAYVRLGRIADDCADQPEGSCSEAEAVGSYRKENVEELGISAAVLLGVGGAALLGAGGIELWRLKQRRSERHSAVRVGPGALLVQTRF